jgi:hypothetical protein
MNRPATTMDAHRFEITADDLRPEHIGYPVETTTVNDHVVGFRLVRYEKLTLDGQPVYHLIGDPAVTVKVEPSASVRFAAPFGRQRVDWQRPMADMTASRRPQPPRPAAAASHE